MTQLAARVGDAHTCPAHVGGPILPPGCTTVVIGGQAAARIDDLCQCQGPTDVIKTGAPTVLIGGKPAARKGDLTRHDGVVAMGFPTVLIGPLAPGDAVASLFTDEYLSTLVGKEWQGANSEQLKKAMETLWEHRHDPNHPDVQEALRQIAEARGKPLEQIQQDWQRYQAALAEQERIAAEKGIDPPPGVNWLHGDHMGSTSQLRYGQVAGDALGMDPVFGALLNPTGGLVGPGNAAVDGNDSAIGYHGAVHDAGGYLYNYHNQGPGYDYLGQEGRDTASPLSGQRSGISYWRDQLPDRSGGQKFTDGAGDVIMDGVVGGIDGVSNAWEATKDAVSDAYEGAKDWASDTWNSLWD
ncbi:PAAR domain-containing protein [Polyangium mundeleinium]|uniref:PAAR domain-containing protein n=1 Tax=Polyangium mundeleinium TaxID=2995306 RepID=A0ABT5EYC8_9BACT|nr:PAAR domain-containing protein [Polyangium mundeleinium]MDC0746837.1 PAAR domain-containing protein [Polyangium mundeleinium]